MVKAHINRTHENNENAEIAATAKELAKLHRLVECGKGSHLVLDKRNILKMAKESLGKLRQSVEEKEKKDNKNEHPKDMKDSIAALHREAEEEHRKAEQEEPTTYIEKSVTMYAGVSKVSNVLGTGLGYLMQTVTFLYEKTLKPLLSTLDQYREPISDWLRAKPSMNWLADVIYRKSPERMEAQKTLKELRAALKHEEVELAPTQEELEEKLLIDLVSQLNVAYRNCPTRFSNLSAYFDGLAKYIVDKNKKPTLEEVVKEAKKFNGTNPPAPAQNAAPAKDDAARGAVK